MNLIHITSPSLLSIITSYIVLSQLTSQELTFFSFQPPVLKLILIKFLKGQMSFYNFWLFKSTVLDECNTQLSLCTVGTATAWCPSLTQYCFYKFLTLLWHITFEIVFATFFYPKNPSDLGLKLEFIYFKQSKKKYPQTHVKDVIITLNH